ncbi:MAG: DUF3426 domain-containing protein [Candidatus Binataceae bacterium]
MIEIQCGSCHTRYRIDERVLPEDTPTFKCSRCGHVFTAEPRRESPKAKSPDPGEPTHPAAKAEQITRPAPAAAIPRPSDSEMPDPRTLRYASIASGGEISPEVPPPPRKPETAPPKSAPEQPVRRTGTEPLPESNSEQSAELNPLARSFADLPDEAGKSGENLSFDFRDEDPSEDESEKLMKRRDADDDWKVGDETPDFEREPDAARIAKSRQGPRVIPGMGPRGATARPRMIPEALSAVADSGKVHSAGIFVAICVIFVIVFGVISMGILSVPVSSAELLNRLPGVAGYFAPPVVPARLVALRDVEAGFQTIKGNLNAFVITGKAENVGNAPLHTIQIAVTLLDGAHRHLSGQAIFCGNRLAPQMVGEMTPRELEFLQNLTPPKNFVLEPLKPVAFTIVFIKPPASMTGYSLMVTRADAASASQIAEAPSS